jgi:Domain of unknown function DUF29
MSDYEHDFYAWTQDQAAALRAQELKTLDWDNLAEEIESLGRRERYAIESHLQTLLTHLLKWRYDPATEPRRGWRITIRNARLGIAKRALGRLQHYPAEYLAIAYPHAREDAADETDLPLMTFPESCPWSVEQVLDPDFWPDPPARKDGDTRRSPPGRRPGPGDRPQGPGRGPRRV